MASKQNETTQHETKQHNNDERSAWVVTDEGLFEHGQVIRPGRTPGVDKSAYFPAENLGDTPVKSSEGYCYVALLKAECAHVVTALLGSFPSFRSLLLLDEGLYLSIEQLSSIRVTVGDLGVCHVEFDSGEWPLISILRTVLSAMSVPPPDRSLAAALRRRDHDEVVVDLDVGYVSSFVCGAEIKGDELLRQQSALPIPVIGEPMSGVINEIAALDEARRGDVAGYNVAMRGETRKLYPRISRKDYDALELSRLPEAYGHLETLLQMMPGISKSVKATLMATKKVVIQTNESGKSRMFMVPRVPFGLDEADLVELGSRNVEAMLVTPSGNVLAERKKKKLYSLVQVFQDLSVLEKYDLTMRQVETAKRLTATDPRGAAIMLQDAMNSVQDHTNVTVRAGEYARDKGQAASTLKSVCAAYPRRSADIVSSIVEDEIFMFGPDGSDGWHVRAPLRYANEATFLYWMVYVEGCANPMELLALETVLLGISVFDGRTYEFPALRYHVGGGDSSSVRRVHMPVASSSLLTANQNVDIMNMRNRFEPIYGAGGLQVATAVRVTGKYALINSHVVDAEPNCTIAGARVDLYAPISRDLWSANSIGDSKPWGLREPVQGETAIICYLLDGQMAVSSPVTITSFDTNIVLTTLASDVVEGFSGGALVGLDDLALLGIHSAATRTNLLSYRFSEKHFSSLLETDAGASVSRQSDEGSFAVRVLEKMRERGLKAVFDTALKSLVPVYVSGQHVGTAVHTAGELYTTCDGSLPLRFGNRGVPLSTTAVQDVPLVKTEVAGLSAVSPVYRRVPQVNERVFVLGYDTEPFVTNETSIMHVSSDKRFFVLGEIPGLDRSILGGLIVGWDGAALGLCGSQSIHTVVGCGYTSWPLPATTVQSPALDARAAIASMFPFLSVASWTDHLIEEVITHANMGTYRDSAPFNGGNKPLAHVGMDALRSAMSREFRQSCIPVARWNEIAAERLSVRRLAEVAWTQGYARLLVSMPGTEFVRYSQAYADMTVALLGAVSLMEPATIFSLLCRKLEFLSFEFD